MTPVQISVYNQAKTPMAVPLPQLVAALQAYVDEYLGPVWEVACKLTVTDGPVPGTWGMAFLDTADVEGALAYHTDEGLPLAKVFVATTLQAGESVSVSASHELAEMLADPGCNAYVMDDSGKLFCLEVADACEETTFEVNGISMSDFVYPAWFEEPTAGDPKRYDYCKVLSAPFALAKGGYATTSLAGQVKQVFGSELKKATFALQDRRGRRGDFRRAKLEGTA